nr:hypothetical protein [Ferrimicrobium acidiphilum]
MVRVLDVSKTTILILNDRKKVEQLPRMPYTYTKYVVMGGAKVDYAAAGGNWKVDIKEIDSKFDITMDGITQTIPDVNTVCEAINAHKDTGKIEPLVALFRRAFIQRFLDFKFTSDLGQNTGDALGRQRLDLSRQGVFVIPKSVSMWADSWMTYHDGARIAKIIFTRDRKDTHNYQVFIDNNDVAVCLTGRDECKQPWLHFLPPSYATKPIRDCELWLFGVNPEQEQVDVEQEFQ